MTVAENPCLACGACCAHFRVSFYWAEADDALGGTVPVAATEPLNTYLRCMKGTNRQSPWCEQLEGSIPGARCSIYTRRSSTCREVDVFLPDGTPDPKCQQARQAFGLPMLTRK